MSRFTFLILIACCVRAQVNEIRFDPPPQAASELRALVTVQPGPYSSATVRQSIERLYETGRFDDIAVDLTAGVLTFRLTPRWFVGGQRVRGAQEPPSAIQLANTAKLALGSEFTESKLSQTLDNLTGLMRINGFYEAKTQVRTTRDAATSLVNIEYQVTPGRRARFAAPKVTGQTQLTADAVARASGWQRLWGWAGYRSVTEQRVSQGVQRIRKALEKRGYLMSSVTLRGLEWQPGAGVAVPTIEINDNMPVDVQVEGVKMSAGLIRKLVPVFQEKSVDRELLNEGTRTIASYLQAQGYFEADVDYERGQVDGREKITFAVDRGPRTKLASISFAGQRYFDEATLRERLSIQPATAIRYRQGRFSGRLLEADQAAITSLYRTNGFLNAQVQATVQTETTGQQRLQTVSFKVDEGAQYLISTLDIAGTSAANEPGIRALMQSAPGQPFSEVTIATDRDAVLSALFNEGYTEASFDWTVLAGETPQAVKLKVDLRFGAQRFVRDVLVTGLERTNPHLVETRLLLKAGQPLSLGQLLESQKRLYDLGIFARVEVGIRNPDGIEASKLVVFDIEEAKKYSFNAALGAQVGRIGSGVQSFESPGGGTGFSPRINLGLNRVNFLGLGHTVSLQGRLSNIQSRVQTIYVAPHFRDRDNLSLAVSALYDESNDVRTYSALRLETAIQLSDRISKTNTIQARYAVRRVSIDAQTLKIQPQLIPRLAQPVRLGILSAAFIQDRRDDPIDSKRGIYNSLDTAVSSKVLGSESNFIRLIGRNSTYHRINRDLTLARTLTFGLQERLTGGVLHDVPFPERFYAGGSASHRGFPENQAGPRDPVTGFPVGGKALLMFGHELRLPVLGDTVGGVLFHDMGNVYSRVGDISFRYRQRDQTDFNYMVQTLGIGLRYKTPIGPIRIDLGYSPNSPRFFGFEGTREQLLFGTGKQTNQRISAFQFHFSLGQTF
ncbi:MAG: BamA/TamA family outer membrane protein [Acidobacteria bacterium]|nr:BamA/TamA family outer membrane protein [Acidobacteriota bacterium]